MLLLLAAATMDPVSWEGCMLTIIVGLADGGLAD